MRGLDADERLLVEGLLARSDRDATDADVRAAKRLAARGLLSKDHDVGCVRVTKLGRDVYEWSKMAR